VIAKKLEDEKTSKKRAFVDQGWQKATSFPAAAAAAVGNYLLPILPTDLFTSPSRAGSSEAGKQD
jgi:hypothetical protein